jgi:hypothetical protein
MKLEIRNRNAGSERGAILFLCILLVVLLGALALSFSALVQKNSGQGRFFNNLGALRRYAETGLSLAIHEIGYGVNGGDGNIGTELWIAGNDLGRDGLAGTFDEGEGNGIPTPGEPNVAGSPIGPTPMGMRLCVHAWATEWPNVTRLVSTAYNGESIANVEVYTHEEPRPVPDLAAAYVDPGTQIKFGGNLTIDGNDYMPDGTRGTDPAVYGLSTAIGDPAGSNALDLVAQVEKKYYDQVLGKAGAPSIGEVTPVDASGLFDEFKARKSQVVGAGNYTDVQWGDWSKNEFKVTYASGDITLAGESKGSGVLLVDGTLTLTGKTNFVGVIIARGDVKLSGGGNEVQVYGSLVASDANELSFRATGSPVIRYSSWALAQAFRLLRGRPEVVCWDYL